ncbi:MAG: septal ring lytic transglycosylase RlpA family protein [Candidatus Obscuribacterales bacterium]|nr:septal ring lytic transglycosylase RlpA family protein [Candidatus Obscuribacterales bacterium]
MGHRYSGSDAGNQKHISTDGIAYSQTASLLGSAEDQYKLYLQDLNTSRANKDVSAMQDILPNVAIYNDGRQRSWEMKNGAISKIVHADGQIWTRKDKKHWNISYQGKLIGKNVEMSNVKIDEDKNLTWTIGGVKKSLSASGEYHDPTLKAQKHDKDQPDKSGAAKDLKHVSETQLDKASVSLPNVELNHGPNHVVEEAHTGKASWYGGKFHGRLTSSGKRFDKDGATAAHKTLPFGTKLEVTNLKNGKSTVVTITDRGPYHGNRVIDLSEGAARKIDMIRTGVVEVSYKKL